VLQELGSAQRCAEALRNQQTGIVRIATSQLIAWTLMPAAFAAFRKLRPDIRVEPFDVAVDEILPSLDAGRVDLAITLAAQSELDLQTRNLFGSRVHVVCGPLHPWAKRKSLRWRDLRDEPLIFTGIDTPQRINAALSDGPQLQAAWQVEHTATALGLVASGFGSAICAGYVEPLLQLHKLHKLSLIDPVVTREFALFTSRRRGSTPAMDALSEFLQGFFSKAGIRRTI
jgi:DNA-binding transcriptional LysR family regulator